MLYDSVLLCLIIVADYERENFAKDHFTIPDTHRSVRRSHLYDDVLKIFSDERIMCEYPLDIKFEDERAVDFGGVSRDMLSGFWEEAYRKIFDGCSLLTPVIHPQVNTQVLLLIGRILSHGYLASSFLPVRITFPTLACIFLGPNAVISDDILLDTFPDCLSEYESGVVQECLGYKTNFDPKLHDKLVGVLSRFGCREIPSHLSLKDILIKVAQYEFIAKPLAAITMISTGISALHASFWSNKSVEELHKLYLALTATSAKTVEIIEASCNNANEERVLGYLQQYVGGMTQDKVRRFLRFTTGSSVCLAKKISVTFNSVCGFSRRSISHTCDCMLELPLSYTTYLDFVYEFDEVLAQPEVLWTMDAL